MHKLYIIFVKIQPTFIFFLLLHSTVFFTVKANWRNPLRAPSQSFIPVNNNRHKTKVNLLLLYITFLLFYLWILLKSFFLLHFLQFFLCCIFFTAILVPSFHPLQESLCLYKFSVYIQWNSSLCTRLLMLYTKLHAYDIWNNILYLLHARFLVSFQTRFPFHSPCQLEHKILHISYIPKPIHRDGSDGLFFTHKYFYKYN